MSDVVNAKWAHMVFIGMSDVVNAKWAHMVFIGMSDVVNAKWAHMVFIGMSDVVNAKWAHMVFIGMSDVVNAKWAICQSYHDKNKLHLMIWWWCMLNWIFLVLAHWNNSLQVDMSLHSDILSRFWAHQSLLSP
jgi:hypothetical protein